MANIDFWEIGFWFLLLLMIALYLLMQKKRKNKVNRYVIAILVIVGISSFSFFKSLHFAGYIAFKERYRLFDFLHPKNYIPDITLSDKLQYSIVKSFPNLGTKYKARYRVGIIRANHFIGESRFASDMAKAADRLGIETYIISVPGGDAYDKSDISKYCFMFVEFANNLLQPDFVIDIRIMYHPKYAVTSYASINDMVHISPTQLARYDGAIFYDKKSFDKLAKGLDKDFFKNFLVIYPNYATTYAREFQELSYKYLFYCGINWDARRAFFYEALFKRLDNLPYFRLFGPEDSWPYMQKSYQGFIKAGSTDYIIDEIQKAGIYLSLHSSEHLELGIPSGRIFEAAAASSVIISDKHPFVIREFGDSVLYVDQDANIDQLYDQIVSHVNWIHTHHKESKLLAKRANNIFNQKFAMEKQFSHIIEAYEQSGL